MKIVTLVENTSVNPDIGCVHGLSYYVETKKHKILVDVGPNTLFYENAKKLGIDISKVDTVFISHGHYDHGGGLELFLKLNPRAKVYLQKEAFEEHFAYEGPRGECRRIGLDRKLKYHPQIRTFRGSHKIDDELYLISEITGRRCFAKSNSNLCIKKEGELVPDPFAHEQALVVKENGKYVLFGGCAHNGILNILDKSEAYMKHPIDVVVSGLHLYSPGSGRYEKEDTIKLLASSLKECKTRIYTGHCTGMRAYDMLHEELGDQIAYLAAGSVLEI